MFATDRRLRTQKGMAPVCLSVSLSLSVCVCVCVRVRARIVCGVTLASVGMRRICGSSQPRSARKFRNVKAMARVGAARALCECEVAIECFFDWPFACAVMGSIHRKPTWKFEQSSEEIRVGGPVKQGTCKAKCRAPCLSCGAAFLRWACRCGLLRFSDARARAVRFCPESQVAQPERCNPSARVAA